MHEQDTKAPFDIIERGIFVTDMKTYTVLVDEEMARDLLLFNVEPERGKQGTNRKASKVRIQLYKQRMLNGEWTINPQPIVFTIRNGKGRFEQSDGQQRLKGFIEACREQPGLRIPLTVTIDAPLEAKMVIDGGKAKLPSDYLRMDGHANAPQLSYAVRLLYCVLNIKYDAAYSWNSFRMSPTTQEKFLSEHGELVNGLKIAYDCKMIFQPYIGAVVYYLLAKEFDAFKAAGFLNGLEKGIDAADMKPGDPRWRVREWLSREKMSGRAVAPYDQYALLVHAANAWLRGDYEWKVPNRIRTMPKLHTAEDLPDTSAI